MAAVQTAHPRIFETRWLSCEPAHLPALQDGKVQTTLEDVVISLDGPSSIVGHSVVVHFGQDDLESQVGAVALIGLTVVP